MIVALTAIVVGALVMSYLGLSTFFVAYTVASHQLLAGHGTAVLLDIAWVASMYLLTTGEGGSAARVMFYSGLAVSLIAAGFLGLTVGGVVSMLVMALPVLMCAGMEWVWSQTFLTSKRVTVTNGLTMSTTPVPKSVDTVTEVANRIITDVLENGTKRPGWNKVAKDYELKQADARRVVALVKEATDA
ncbi:hypothetical protein [Nocardiopsis alba]|uniref:hypothetical protein n=1 Tax=Nocardiopsis alba TaxID=53437 RepID=UPI0005A0EF89|nr:hypothetical protein [Nocardiopsis alba]